MEEPGDGRGSWAWVGGVTLRRGRSGLGVWGGRRGWGSGGWSCWDPDAGEELLGLEPGHPAGAGVRVPEDGSQ